MKLKKTYVATLAITSLLKISISQAATFDWTGGASENFTDVGNWSQNEWAQWGDYRFGGTPIRSSTTINGFFGIGSITLQSGLTTDIVINSTNAQPVIMNTAFADSGLASISIAADSRDLTINGEYIASSAVTWDVGSGRTLTMNGPLNNWFSPASLIKNGAGTATLTQMGNYTGSTTVNGGTLNLADGDWVTGQPWNASGATGAITVGSGATLSTSAGVTQIKSGLTLNGGTVSSRGNTYSGGNGTWGNLLLSSDITAGNSASSTISSEIRLDANRSVDVGSGSTLTISGGIAISPSGGTFGITKNGVGTLVLSGANSYNGVTNITAGTLVAANNSALGESGWSGDNMTFVRDGATLALQGGVSINEHMHLYGAGVGGLGAIRSISGDNALTMTFSNSGSGPGFSINSNTTIGVDAGSLTATGFYETGGSFGLTKVGAGTLVLTTSSSYTGGTTINGGTLSLAGSGALPSSGSVTIGAGGRLSNDAASGTSFALNGITLNGGELAATSTGDFSLGNFYLQGDVTVGGSARSTISADLRVISNQTRDFNVGATGDASGVDLLITGRLGHQNNVAWGYGTKSGDGVMKLTGVNELGGMTVNAGRFILEDNAIGWTYPVSGLVNNSELEFSVTNGSRSYEASLNGSGSLFKTGAGTMTLTASNGYTGTTNISGGTLVLQGSGGGGTDYNGGNININGASTLRITGERYNFSGETIAFNSTGGGTIDAIASGAGGTVFTGSNTIMTNGGAQNLISGTRLDSQNQGFNLNSNNVTFDVASGTDTQSDLKLTATLWNNGNVIKTGAGRLEIAGTNYSYTGTTTVSAGTLIVNANISTSTQTTVESGATIAGSGTVGALTVNAGAFINPGNSPGVLNTGNYNQAGTLIAEIAGISPGTQHDQINVTGSVTLTGALTLDTLNAGTNYVFGDVIFLILNDDVDAVVGTFSNFAEGSTVGSFGGFDWIISYQADFDNNSFFNGNDVGLRAVPEPSAALLTGLGVLGLLRRRRR